MRIEKQVYDEIISLVRENPPEMGGILGRKGTVICSYELDYGNAPTKMCSYSPNVSKLNIVIEKWQKEGIELAGIFHTHFFGVSTLSKGDIAYIFKIMESVRQYINELLFPIVVLPEKKIVSYKALVVQNQISIIDDCIIVEGGKNNE